jgi:ATP-dependent Clp protease ATP-binding subunit ClpA
MESLNINEPDIFAANGWLLLDAFDSYAYRALKRGASWTVDTRWDSVRTPHLLMGVLSTGHRHVQEWCRLMGADADSLLIQFASLFMREPNRPVPLIRLNREFISENAIRCLRHAAIRARRACRKIRLIDLIVAVLSPAGGTIVSGCFAEAGLSPDHLTALAVAAEERNPTPRPR